jgi:hypothetical protein
VSRFAPPVVKNVVRAAEPAQAKRAHAPKRRARTNTHTLRLPAFPSSAIGSSPWVQAASLKISQPSDPLEVEAERSADRVLRMPDDLSEPSRRTEGALVQRACAACEAEDSMESVQRKALSSHSQGGPLAHGAPNVVSAALGSPSTALDDIATLRIAYALWRVARLAG